MPIPTKQPATKRAVCGGAEEGAFGDEDREGGQACGDDTKIYLDNTVRDRLVEMFEHEVDLGMGKGCQPGKREYTNVYSLVAAAQ